jgi:hypothetical protein
LTGRSGSDVQKWQEYQFIAGDANSDAKAISEAAGKTQEERDKAERDARLVNKELAQKSFREVKDIDQKTKNDIDKKKVQYILSAIAQISGYSQFLEPVYLPGESPEDVIETI